MLNPRSSPLLAGLGLGRRKPGADDDWLLRDIDFSLAEGDRLAIVGPSGSGKTLLLRALAMLDPLDIGEVLCTPGALLHGDQILR